MINEYGDDGFADPETDIDFDDETVDEVPVTVNIGPVDIGPVEVPEEAPVPAAESTSRYEVVNADGTVALWLPVDRPWGIELVDGQFVRRSDG